MAFVKPLPENFNSEVAELAKFFNETLGFCPNSVLTMQRRPEIATAFINLNKAVMANHGRVTSSLKRLIGLIASQAAGCRYCQAHTVRAAERYGASVEQIENVWEFRTHPSFNEAERTALELAYAASVIPNAVTPELQSTVREHWDDGEIVEIMGVISLFGYLNRWNDSMATSIEDAAAESGNQWLNTIDWEKGKHS